MIAKDYISFEAAKLLKEKGFDYPTETGYNEDGHTIERACNIGERSIYGDAYNWNKEEIYYSRPTLWEAMRWLRRVRKLYIEIRIMNFSISKSYDVPKYYWIVLDAEKVKWLDESTCYTPKGFDTFEESCESAVKHCLEKLI